MLFEVYDREPGDRELTLFLAYFDHNSDGRISWPEFREGLSKVAHHMQIQNRTGGKRHLKAPWEVAKAPRVIGPGEVKSSQQTVSAGMCVRPASAVNYCTGRATDCDVWCHARGVALQDVGDDGEDPRGRPLMQGVGMRGTTTDLFAGTSKTTRQLPGYGGYIPQAHRQASDAEAQAAGNGLRNTYHAKTNLLLTVNPAPPGYTGHKSRAPEHMSLGRKVRLCCSVFRHHHPNFDSRLHVPWYCASSPTRAAPLRRPPRTRLLWTTGRRATLRLPNSRAAGQASITNRVSTWLERCSNASVVFKRVQSVSTPMAPHARVDVSTSPYAL